MSSSSKVYYAIAFKFLAKQIHLVIKKSMCAICKRMNINVDFRIFVNVSHSAFLKKKLKHKIKMNNFLENRGDTCVENAMILTYAKIQIKITIAKVGAPESYFWD